MSTPPRPERRRFLNWFLGTTLGGLALAILYPIARFLRPPEVPEATTSQVEAGLVNAPEFLSQGYKIVRFGSEPVIVIRVTDDDFRAFSATCTHLACIVEYQRKEKRIWCNCHNGVYDLQGRNIGGPPPKPLTKYDVHLVEQTGQPATVIVAKG
jgi:cytochrome b6-f complex iron-sulfur subunit